MLILDIDNTILPSTQAYESALSQIQKAFCKKYNLPLQEFNQLYQQSRQETKQDLAGQASNRLRILYFKKVLEKIQGNLTVKDLNSLIKWEEFYFHHFQNFLKSYYKQHKNNYKLAWKVLKDISRKYSIVFLSNENCRTQILKITSILPNKIPFHILTSEEVGVEKPNPKIFEKAIQKVSKATPKDKMIMIGDNWEDDIQGALRVGIPAIYQKEIWNPNPNIQQLEPMVFQTHNFLTSLRLASSILTSGFSLDVL